VKARAYCRNLKLKHGEPFGLIRLEAEERFAPTTCPAEAIEKPAFAAKIWKSRFGNLGGRVTRLSREVQTLEIADRVERGELDYKQGERLAMFLELERLGIAKAYYPKTVYSARRREARKLGYGISDTGASPLDVELSGLLRPYVEAVEALEPRDDAG
jgi:hypothetical protein